ncbi:MAG: hypothetical protein WB555_09215 [Candidatus Korobacteraceae bacterium]
MRVEPSTVAAPVESSPASSRNRSLISFLEKYCVVICLAFVAIACIRIVSTYNALSLTIDEPVHLAAGIEYLANHAYSVDAEHPPLSRAVQALGPYLAGARPRGFTEAHDQGNAIIGYSGHVDRMVFLMRLGNLPFFLLACGVVSFWSRHAFGKATAALATALFTLLPTILADAGLATTDLALAATVGATFLTAVLWAEKPTWLRALLFGLFGALALLSKFSSVGYVPFSLLLAFLCYVLVVRPNLPTLWKLTRERIATFALAVVTCAFVVWAGFWFSIGPIPRFHVSLPAPELFTGLSVVLRHNAEGHGAFLFGQYSKTGWWYYFPVALALKTPIAFLILAILGVVVCFKKWRQLQYLIPLAFCLAILVPAMAGRIDIGIRHIEPIYLGLSIIAALGLVWLLELPRFQTASTLAGLALVGWMAVSVALHHPDYLTYFNAFAGKHPENLLVDSNYDWGQGLKFLSARLRQLGAQQVALGSISGVGRPIYLQSWYGLPPVTVVDENVPSPGWTAVSVTWDKSYRLQLSGTHPAQAWYGRIPPTERFGVYSLYYVPEGARSEFLQQPSSQSPSSAVPPAEAH